MLNLDDLVVRKLASVAGTTLAIAGGLALSAAVIPYLAIESYRARRDSRGNERDSSEYSSQRKF